MRTIVKNMLLAAAVTLTASPFAIAQNSSNGFDEWYRAKYGRPSPVEEARIEAEQANTAYREVASTAALSPGNGWFEGWYRAKYGRPSPIEGARLEQYQANTAYREVAPVEAAPAGNTWFEGWYRAKYGRPSPLEPSRSVR